MLMNKSIIFLIFIHLFIVACTQQSELKWNEEENYRWAEVTSGYFGSTGFERLSPDTTDIFFSNDLNEKDIIENQHFLNGSGVALGDINGNGLVDIYFASIKGPNKLYKNLGGFQFEDITDEAGVSHEDYYSTGVVFADVNGNGALDLLVASLGQGTSLYLNDGQGNFKLNEDSGLNSDSGNHTMALADINGNGFLDLYVVNNNKMSVRDKYDIRELFVERIVTEKNGSFDLVPPFDEYFTLFVNNGNPDPRQHGEEDEFYINQGDGTFKKILDHQKYFLDEFGNDLGFKPDWGLSAKFQDLNGNGLPDLYVANDFWTPDRIWMNQGDGTFRAVEQQAFRQFSYSSMDVDFSDVNRDGYTDIFVTEMLNPDHELRMTQSVNANPEPIKIGDTNRRALNNHNSLFINRGDNTFAQTAFYSGVAASGWSWAAKFIDINLNGFEDIILTTGYLHDGLDYDTQDILGDRLARNQLDSRKMILEFPKRDLQNIAYKNNQDLTFTDVSSDWGFNEIDIAHGLAVADLNNNGVLDVVVNRMNDHASIYKNQTNAPRIAVKLKGNYPNTRGIGAKIELEGGPVHQAKEVSAGGEYLSGSDSMVVFAADSDNSNHVLTVRWPNGSISKIENVKAQRIYEIDETSSEIQPEETIRDEPNEPLFKDISDRIAHKHHENDFDDFQIQPLLPLKLSQLGPGVSWLDINRNGYDDLLISTGKDGQMSIFENLGDGHFKPAEYNTLNEVAPGDQTAIVGWGERDYTRLIVGNANYEQGDLDLTSAFDYKISPDGRIDKQQFPSARSTSGAIAAADYNSNGYIDVFIGGRFVPGRYPQDASSRLYINEDGTFGLDEMNSEIFENVGLVTGALFADFNDNGKQDLLLSTEWGSLKLFENDNGHFREITEEVGLDVYKGWWNGIAVGDFNNNGLPDIVATNLGLNSPYGNIYHKPLKLFYSDFNWDGRVNIIESYFHDRIGTYVPKRNLYELDKEIPQLTNNIRTHADFASMAVEDVLQLRMTGTELESIPSKEINTLEHMIFLNEGGQFSANPLPKEAQLTSAFYVGVADFNNDGNEDLFISQNSFVLFDNTTRLDSGRGLILLGDSNGNFESLSGMKSGIKIYGEQRGAALSDFNQDGKIDVAVSQNGADTKLYLNQCEKKGFRVSIQGPEGNRDGIGSSLRFIYEGGIKGPKRYVQAGSGLGSQNSATQVLGWERTPIEIEVQWFDGKREYVPVTGDNMNHTISYN